MARTESMSLAAKVILGCLVVTAVIVVALNLCLGKKRQNKPEHTNKENSMQMNDTEKLIGLKLNGANTHGYCAPDQDSLREVARWRSHSPTSTCVFSPSTPISQWDESSEKGFLTVPDSMLDSGHLDFFAMPESTAFSTLKSPPPRLQSSNAPFYNYGTDNLSTSGGAYNKPLPQSKLKWISPLGVGFSNESAPGSKILTSPYESRSFLPQFEFPKGSDRTGQAKISQPGLMNKPLPIVRTANDIPPMPQLPPLAQIQSPSISSLSSFSSREARQSKRSIFPASSDDERPYRRASTKSNHFPVPPIPQEYFFDSPITDAGQFSPRPGTHDSLQDATKDLARTGSRHSIAASSVYSSLTTGKETKVYQPSQSSESQPTNRSRSRSASHKRTISGRSLSRTQDSLRRATRKASPGAKRRSKEHGQDHYETTPPHKTSSVSIRGRKKIFDEPRESLLSNTNVTSNHSPSASVSTISTKVIAWQENEQLPKSFIQLNLTELDQSATTNSEERQDRRGSEVSQGSIGDFYDSYYRQSMVAQRNSTTSQTNLGNGETDVQALEGVGIAISSVGNIRRPAPAKVADGRTGVPETIEEMPSPAPSLMLVERFPRII